MLHRIWPGEREARRRGVVCIAGWLLVLLACGPAAAKPERVSGDGVEPLRVLFIGNSLTFFNQMPTMVEELSRAGGCDRPVDAEMIARGGETFYGHTERRDDSAPLTVIARGGWDFVVLQENGRLMARSGLDSFPFASRLVRAARAAGATPIFYLTWAYCDRPETHSAILDAYTQIGSRLDVAIAPVGEVWRRVRVAAPGLELFDPDGVHPSPRGSYLAAWVILSTIQRERGGDLLLAEPIVAVSGVEPAAARRLQRLASQNLSRPR